MVDTGKPRGSFTEEIEIGGSELVARIKNIVDEGKVSRIRIKASDGGIYLDMPLPWGAVAGGAVAIAAPWLAILGVIAAMVAKVDVEITRVETGAKTDEPRDEDKAA